MGKDGDFIHRLYMTYAGFTREQLEHKKTHRRILAASILAIACTSAFVGVMYVIGLVGVRYIDAGKEHDFFGVCYIGTSIALLAFLTCGAIRALVDLIYHIFFHNGP